MGSQILIILGSWFFRARGTKRNGTLLAGSGSLRLIALTFAIMIIVALAVVLLSKYVFTAALTLAY
jgi:hypothetical protein